MNKRKDALREMLAPIAAQPAADRAPARPAMKSGSLKAMGLSLQSLSEDAEAAQVLREQIDAGAHIIELDPDLIDGSFIRDRLPDEGGADFETLQASIAEHGQQVPILVRPSAQREGRYQVAYGHRRLEATRRLQRPVKAIVRRLSDEELIVAQGKENNERRDLSFIERALFAARLEDHGFSRAALTAALGLHKGNLSTMIAVARAVPEALIVAIGPAQKIGRPRWEQLAALVRDRGAQWSAVIAAAEFRALDSDARFSRVLDALIPKRPQQPSRMVTDAAGKAVAKIEEHKGRVRLTIDETATAAFGAHLVEKLPELYAAFRRRMAE